MLDLVKNYEENWVKDFNLIDSNHEIIYSDKSTYKHFISDEKLKYISSLTNRKTTQTEFLYNLVGGNIDLLILLERKIKNNGVPYCPGSLSDIKEILDMKDKSDFAKF